MIKYAFREDAVMTFPKNGEADPQKIGEALAKISAAAEGKLTPTAVVEAARSRNHPLHRHFEWDDASAAHLYRIDQARCIIRCVTIVDEKDESVMPAFLSISDAKSGVSYRTVQEVLGSEKLQLQVMLQAERDLTAFETRYRSLTDVCDLVRTARGKLLEQRTTLESRVSS